jgi:hypothetical protein
MYLEKRESYNKALFNMLFILEIEINFKRPTKIMIKL